MIDPSNLWLTIHESIGHATELDRALGYEAAYAGTSFATPDKLGTLRYGSPIMNVTGDRTVEHGLATIGYDDEGVATQQFDIVRTACSSGISSTARWPAANGIGPTPTGARSPTRPGTFPCSVWRTCRSSPPRTARTTEELISGVERGIYVLGDRSWSIDMQRYNFQFTGQQFFRIENGRLAGQLRDVAYQATTTDFWGLDGGGRRARDLRPRRRVQLRQGPARPGRRRLARLPDALFRGVNVLNTSGGRRPMIPMQDLVERVLTPSTADGCIVVGSEHTETNLRWAANNLTTNGQMASRSVTVISTVDGAAGPSAGVVTRSVTSADEVPDLVLASELAARKAGPADDAAPLVEPYETRRRLVG